jgi:CRISPR-associated protein Cas6/Cse3/CasE subtype I-E
MTDYLVTKPTTTTGYALHRIAQGLTGGASPLFTDHGDHMVLRSDKEITAEPRAIRPTHQGDIVGFELRACVGTKVKGRHRYFHTADWRSRHHWLARQGERHGFEVITVHCTATIAKIKKGDREFTLDQTDFTGVLKVTDESKFGLALAGGVGSKARAFGFGMINL